MFEKVKRFYDMSLYSKRQVAQFVARGKLTPAEYEAITGEQYEDAP